MLHPMHVGFEEDDVAKMSGLPLGSMQTWHPGQLKGAKKMLNEVNYKATMDKTVEEAKKFVEKAGDDITKQEARRLMENLCEAIETLKTKEAGRRNSVGISRQTSTAIPSTTNFGTIREEPHFESMIFCSPPHSIAARSRSNIAGGDDHRSLTTLESCCTIDAPLTSEKDPLIIRIMPHLLIICSAVCYILGGAWVFQQIDEELGQKDYRFIVIFSFQICATIGWGDSHPSHDWSRVFCTAYAIFGVPVLFSALSNMGRIISELYCVDWLFLTAVVRGKKNHEQSREIRRRLPIKVAINLLLIHQFIGLILFNGPINDFGVVESVYFSITSMATIGFGDFVPHPKNYFELAVILTYLATGITLLSALYISISYYFQYFHYVTFVSWMRWFHMKLWNRRKRVKAPKPTENGKASSINNGFIENEKY